MLLPSCAQTKKKNNDKRTTLTMVKYPFKNMFVYHHIVRITKSSINKAGLIKIKLTFFFTGNSNDLCIGKTDPLEYYVYPKDPSKYFACYQIELPDGSITPLNMGCQQCARRSTVYSPECKRCLSPKDGKKNWTKFIFIKYFTLSLHIQYFTLFRTIFKKMFFGFCFLFFWFF